LKNKAEQLSSVVLVQLWTGEDREQSFEQDWCQFVQTNVTVTPGIGGFAVQLEEELDSGQHHWQFLRFGPLHELP
jgi:hypothetical protein